MREQTLRDFFEGRVPAADLRRDLEGAVERIGLQTSRQRITDMAAEFEVRPEHLVRLCDAVLAGDLAPESIEVVGFCLVASDRFTWNGDAPEDARVAEAAYDWSAPTVNYALTRETVVKFRHRLLTGEDTFARSDTWSARHGRAGLRVRHKDPGGGHR